jgi:arginine decarboxylase-like protein
VLEYVEYDRDSLVAQVKATIDRALEHGELELEESSRLLKRYEQALEETTYLSRE